MSASASTVIALLLTVLTLTVTVSGLAGSLGRLETRALQASWSGVALTRTLLSVQGSYDADGFADQDRSVRATLQPAVSSVGGRLVQLNETVGYGVVGGPGSTVTFASVDEPSRLPLVAGSAPAEDETGLTVVAPAATAKRLGWRVGDRVRLRSRLESSTVTATVVGLWETQPTDPLASLLDDGIASAPGAEEAAATGLQDRGMLLVAPGAFGRVATSASSARWVAVPDLPAIEPDRLGTSAARVREAMRGLEMLPGTGWQSGLDVSSDLPELLDQREAALVSFRSVVLVPAVLLVALGVVSLLVVGALFAASRLREEQLLRARGATAWQLARGTVAEALSLGAVAALLGPPLAWLVLGRALPVGLDLQTWVASGVVGLVSAAALTVPALARARWGDLGEGAQRRSQHLAGVVTLAGALVVLALAGLAAVQLRGDSGASEVTGQHVDAAFVSAPTLVLLGCCLVLMVAVIPVAWALSTLSGRLRGLVLHLGAATVLRGVTTTAPVVLVVAMATATVWFAGIQRASHDEARSNRAAYLTGADVAVVAPPSARRPDPLTERDVLDGGHGIDHAMAVRRSSSLVEGVEVEGLVADLAARDGTTLDAQRFAWALSPATLARLISRPWAEDDAGTAAGVGVGGDDTAISLTLATRGGQARSADLLLAARDGGVLTVPAEVRGRRVEFRPDHPLPARLRLVGARFEFIPSARCSSGGSRSLIGVSALRVGSTVDPAPEQRWVNLDRPAPPVERLRVRGCGSRLGQPLVLATVGFDDEWTPPPAVVPAVVTDGLAEGARVAVGDTLTSAAAGTSMTLRIVGVVPYLPTVPEGREGILVDAGTVDPAVALATGDDRPSEWWVVTRPDGRASAATYLRAHLPGSTVNTVDERVWALRDDPATGGGGLATVLACTAAAALVVGAVMVCATALLRRHDREVQAAALRGMGASGRQGAGLVSWDYALTTGLATVVGVAAGVLTAAVSLRALSRSPSGLPLVPPPPLDLPWQPLAAGLVGLVVVPLVFVLALSRREMRRALATMHAEEAR